MTIIYNVILHSLLKFKIIEMKIRNKIKEKKKIKPSSIFTTLIF